MFAFNHPFLRSHLRRIAVGFNRFSSPIDKYCWNPTDRKARFKPIIILGPPRSGTTLLYQLLVASFRTCYWSNALAFMYRCPKLSGYLYQVLDAIPHAISYTSEYGKTAGLWGPCEASLFWDQWFPRDPSIQSTIPLAELPDYIHIFSNQAKKPFVGKSVFATHGIQEMYQHFDSVFFVIPLRDPRFLTQSLLLNRRKNERTASPWLTVWPKNREISDSLSDLEQTTQQVLGLYDEIATQLASIPPSSYSIIAYADLCQDSTRVLRGIKQVYDDSSNVLPVRQYETSQFKPSEEIRIARSEFDFIETIMAEEWPPIASRLQKPIASY